MIRRNQDDDDDEWDKIEDDEYPLSSDGENDEFDRAYVVFDHSIIKPHLHTFETQQQQQQILRS